MDFRRRHRTSLGPRFRERGFRLDIKGTIHEKKKVHEFDCIKIKIFLL